MYARNSMLGLASSSRTSMSRRLNACAHAWTMATVSCAIATPVSSSRKGPRSATPTVAGPLDIVARSVAEMWCADYEDLEAVRAGLVAAPGSRRDAHRIPLHDLDDLVVELHPAAAAHHHVHLFLLHVRVA